MVLPITDDRAFPSNVSFLMLHFDVIPISASILRRQSRGYARRRRHAYHCSILSLLLSRFQDCRTFRRHDLPHDNG